jgi:hypothetical protein
LAGAAPLVEAQEAPVQRLQSFLSASVWDAEAVNARRLELAGADAESAPHEGGVLVIDETGDRKDGAETAHVAHQYLGSVGKIANGIVAVTSLWADERAHYPLHVVPYTPAARLPQGKKDPALRTKPQLAAGLVGRAQDLGVPFRAVVADSIYGESAGWAYLRRPAPIVVDQAPATAPAPAARPAGGKRTHRGGTPAAVVAGGAAAGAGLVGPVDHALALLACLVEGAPAARFASAA